MEFIYSFDLSILEFIQENMRFHALDIVLPFISTLGNAGFIWIITALVLMLTKKYRTVGITILTALLLCLLIGNAGLKPLIARTRPFGINREIVLLIPRPTDYSFPSGHTMSSFAAATVIFLNDKRLGACALALGAVIAFSRLYLYVHYPTDILGGIVIGIIIGILSFFLVHIIKKRYKKYKLWKGLFKNDG